MKILVTGGTGVLGQQVVQAAGRAGHAVRVGSRRARPEGATIAREWAQMDLVTGEGVRAAVAGVDAVVHAASDSRRPDEVDVIGTRHLVEAARAAGVGHLVYVSIVGIDRIPVRYYRRKLVAEEIVANGSLPYSILRATQFHTLVDAQLRKAARVPLVIPIPTSFRIQSVVPSEVAARLLRSVAEGPGGRLPDFGGPEVLTLGEAAAQWKAARAVRKSVMHLPLPGRIAAAFRRGESTVPDGERGTVTWREWLRRTGTGARGGRSRLRAA
jgi:uncharacterized protein YbjT (DUF2867 family)